MKLKNPGFFVKKTESKKATSWNKLVKDRMHDQHGGGEIPEGDHHAIPKIVDPTDIIHRATPEETEAALHELEENLDSLRRKEERLQHPQPKTIPNPAPKAPQDDDDWID